MKRWTVALVVSAVTLVLVGVPALALTAAHTSSGAGASTRTPAETGDGKVPRHRTGSAGTGRGHGPPSWAHGSKAKHGTGPGSDWRLLTPVQRTRLMADLVRRHTEGMQDWVDCVAAGLDGCVKPLPPGLAKRGQR